MAWITENWAKINDAVLGVIGFLQSVLEKFAKWPILDVEI